MVIGGSEVLLGENLRLAQRISAVRDRRRRRRRRRSLRPLSLRRASARMGRAQPLCPCNARLLLLLLTRLRCTVLAGVAGGGGCAAGGVRGHVARLPDELGRLLLGPQADGGCQRDRKSGRVPERVSAPVPPRLPTATAAAAAAAPALPALSCAARLRCAAALRGCAAHRNADVAWRARAWGACMWGAGRVAATTRATWRARTRHARIWRPSSGTSTRTICHHRSARTAHAAIGDDGHVFLHT
jgi:hypothetical protein